MTDNGSHNKQKKIALVSDVTGFGRCAAAIQLPVISALKVQCCLLPTAVLSNHTAFEDHFMMDLTPQLPAYIEQWKKLGLEFEGICTGFLGSAAQADIISGFIDGFRTERTIVVVDPVMGDHGKAYKTCTADVCEKMKDLVRKADIALPNVTEACILTGTEYREDFKIKELTGLAAEISASGPEKVVITGISQGSFIANLCYSRDGSAVLVRTKRVSSSRFGTGDIFSAIISADAVNGVSLERSVRRAADFIRKCILKTEDMDLPLTDGVCFEELLGELHR
ncbi:MAG: pyridoxamine kinase [Lachnospiraceae bacterium]|nr:pyridoxamine kinase [Lachnospiraceae bacterium]